MAVKQGQWRFTLIEMLIVISLIVLLSGLLLPALFSALGAARKTSCQSRMRAVYTAMVQYVSDNNGWMPPMDNVGGYTLYCAPYTQSSAQISQGRVLSTNFSEVYYCPSAVKPAESPVWPAAATMTLLSASCYTATVQYSCMTADNGSGGWLLQMGAGAISANRRFMNIRNGCVIMGEALYSGNDGFYNRTDYWGIGSLCTGFWEHRNAPAWYHEMTTDFLFKDGTVKSYGYTGARLLNTNFCPL